MSTRHKLLGNAAALFAELGYHGTKLSDIADRTGTNTALLCYHFGDKKNLLMEVLRTLSSEKISGLGRILKEADNHEDFSIRLKMFMNELSIVYIEQASLIKIIFDLLEQGNRIAEATFNESHTTLLSHLEIFLKMGQKKGFVNKDTDIRVLLIQLIGPLNFLVRSVKSAKKQMAISLADEKFREELIESLVDGINDQSSGTSKDKYVVG